MKFNAILIVGCGLLALSAAYPREEAEELLDEKRESKRYDAIAARLFGRRGALDCKPEGEPCRGFPPCCEEAVCFWENGWSARTPGVCVPCVDRGQKCQTDSQCCEPLVCQKATTYTTDGTCDVKKPLGAECHDNDQCESDYCKIHWYNDVVMGKGGKCATPSVTP